jgi:hypothetical protein
MEQQDLQQDLLQINASINEPEWEDVDIDETDGPLMKTIAQLICPFVADAFCGMENFQCDPVHLVPSHRLHQFADLIESNLNDYYVSAQGTNWKENKLQEMTEPGLIYGWCMEQDDLVMFILFKLCNNEDLKVLYLYEIQISKPFQKANLGSTLMSCFHKLVSVLNNCTLKNDCSHYLHGIDGTALTVFPKNTIAANWYFKLGYNYTQLSPRPRTLRNGKMVYPSYYTLYKLIE